MSFSFNNKNSQEFAILVSNDFGLVDVFVVVVVVEVVDVEVEVFGRLVLGVGGR